MAQAIIPREIGDEYQKLVFWQYALKMLLGTSEIDKVGYECDEIKTFDDVVVYYANPQKYRKKTISKEYIQVKFHVRNNDSFTFDNLIDPKFINATKYSLLDKVVMAYRKMGDDFTNCKFTIYSVWEINQSDTLFGMISHIDKGIDIDKLFDGTGDTSRTGKIRKKLRESLGVTEEELKIVLGQVCIRSGQDSYEDMVRSLNNDLKSLGLKLISGSQYQNHYTDLIGKLFHAGYMEYDNNFIIEQLLNEGLYNDEKEITHFVISSYKRHTENLECETDSMLKLDNYVSGKFLKDNFSWEDLYPIINKYINSICVGDRTFYCQLETNFTIAFMAGRILDIKAGKDIVPVQRTDNGIKIWRPEEKDINEYAEAGISDIDLDDSSKDVAVVIEFTREILNDVKEYIVNSKLNIGRIITIRTDNIGSKSVKDGTHALILANQIKNEIDKRKSEEKLARLHLFVSCPISIVFLLGRYSFSFGKVQMYDYDMLKIGTGTYYPTVMFPIKGEF